MKGIYRAGYSIGLDGGLITSCPWQVGADGEWQAQRDAWMEGFRAGSDRREVARTRRFR